MLLCQWFRKLADVIFAWSPIRAGEGSAQEEPVQIFATDGETKCRLYREYQLLEHLSHPWELL